MKTKIANKEALMRILKDHADQIYSFGVQSLYLFGSFKRNENIRENSDIDLLVDFESGQKSIGNLIELGDLVEKLTDRKVELVTREGLSRHISPYILNDLEYVSKGRTGIH